MSLSLMLGLDIADIADVADASAGTDLLDRRRVRLEIRILIALGQKEAAQDLRWRTFEASLDAEILREYITHLPDFEEFDAIARALAYRVLLDDILAGARSPAYGHGARYLAKLDDLETEGILTAGLTDHESYRAGLRKAHGRKAAFWSIVDAAG